jgi:hypothetical protein
MRWYLGVLLVGLIGVAAVGCGAETGLEVPLVSTRGSAHGSTGSSSAAGGSSAVGGASAAGGASADAGDDAYGAYGPPPVPTCTGELSQCVQNDAGTWSGSAVIHCDGVYFVGPWTLVLEREIGTQFQSVQVQVVEEPGFGATFYDMTGPMAELTYRVCVEIPEQGTKCGTPFTTYGSVNCGCEPFTCDDLQACFIDRLDGCGGNLPCGACTNGAPCNIEHNCCPVGQAPNGVGGCQCGPSPLCGTGG